MSFVKRTIRQVPIDGKTVIVRVDYNVPLDENGAIHDDFRIKASLPTLRYLLKNHCKVVIISHLGRPHGREEKYSLEPIAKRLSELLGVPVHFASDCIGDIAKQAVKKTPPRGVVLLENLRFHPEETANDEDFARNLVTSTGARYFVQDGFSVIHRAHASTDAITHYIPGVAGFLVEREYDILTKAMKKPERPLVAVLGGAKVSDKIPALEGLIGHADRIIIGGAMANTFLQYKRYEVGKSKTEDGQTTTLDRIYTEAHAARPNHADDYLMLPADVAVAKPSKNDTTRRNVTLGQIAKDDSILDIGDFAIESMVKEVQKAKTVIWNGTLGEAELSDFAHGSARLALELATHPDVTSIIGGGDTVDFVTNWDSNNGESFSHISTGGGAMLDLIAGERLPGIESLLDKPR